MAGVADMLQGLYDPMKPTSTPAQPQPPNPILAGRQMSPSYNTTLNPLDEFAYRDWVQKNNVPTDPDATAPQDYDMRGFYKGLQQGNPKAASGVDPNDGRLHFNDFWKVPTHPHFSAESQYAAPTAPSWTQDDKLVNPNGRVVYDDQAANKARNDGGLLFQLGLK